MAFQFDHNHIHPDVAGVLRQVNRGGVILRIARLHSKRRLFPVRETELPLGIGEEHRDRSEMAVRDRLLVRAIVHFQNSYLIVFAHDRVMLGISLDCILGRDPWGKLEAHRHAIERSSHSHIAPLKYFVGIAEKPPNPTSQRANVNLDTGINRR
jgi:hypothetical protein